VITNNRVDSLTRLVGSLDTAVYFGDRNAHLILNLEQTADRATIDLANRLEWLHGPLTVRHRMILGGLMPAVVESWYPSDNDSYGVLLEDDVELSPLFYAWIKFSILYYRYYTPAREQAQRLFGVSLYQQKALEYLPDGRKPFNASEFFDGVSLPPTTPYLTQIPCSWGAVYFPEVWREFHDFLALRLAEVAISVSTPVINNIRSNRWLRSWKRYMVELIYLRGYTMLYPNYPHFSSFSTNHLEIGDHVKDLKAAMARKALFEVPLRRVDEGLLDLPEARLPDWDELPVVDFWGQLVTEDEIVYRGKATVESMQKCPPLGNGTPAFDARELLCRADKKASEKNKPPAVTAVKT
jgi:hypothetical protein